MIERRIALFDRILVDGGVWRRIRLIPFTHTIPKQEVDRQLPEKKLRMSY